MVFAWWHQKQQARRACNEALRAHEEKLRAAERVYEEELLDLAVDFYYFLLQQPGVREALCAIEEEAETLARKSIWIRQPRRGEDSLPPTLALFVELQQASAQAATRYDITAVKQAIKTKLRRVLVPRSVPLKGGMFAKFVEKLAKVSLSILQYGWIFLILLIVICLIFPDICTNRFGALVNIIPIVLILLPLIFLIASEVGQYVFEKYVDEYDRLVDHGEDRVKAFAKTSLKAWIIILIILSLLALFIVFGDRFH